MYLGFMVLDISTQSWMDPLLWAQKRQMIGRQESEKKTLLVLLTEKRWVGKTKHIFREHHTPP